MSGKVIYTVYEAANGYYAELPLGRIVIGKTLKEVAEEANAAVTEEMTANPTGEVSEAKQGWQKGLVADEKNTFIRLFSSLFPPGVDSTSEVSGNGYTRGKK